MKKLIISKWLAIRSLHSIPGHFKKVRARVRKEQAHLQKT